MLKGKNILLGITGSIAAYKAAILVRLLTKEGACVKVVMTPLAKQFITPLTMATLSRNPILVDFFDPENGEWNSHVSLGEWADLYIIAPATANTIGKMVSGIADNLLLTTYLSARCSVFVSPAMDLDMYAHPTTKRNLEALHRDGVHIIEPQTGFLASGLTGKGRMEEPEEIVEYVKSFFSKSNTESILSGRKVLVTAGGTIEPIDSVRYISNYSTGKMGYAIASELASRGADVTIVRAGVSDTLKGSLSKVKEIVALSAQQMYDVVTKLSDDMDVFVMSAAVADFTPASVADHKIKKAQGENMELSLTQTRDIAAAVGSTKKAGQVLVGFALETDDEQNNALRKLEKKNLDIIVLNSLRDEGAGFASDTNKVTVFRKDMSSVKYPLKSKCEVAVDIVNEIERQITSFDKD